MVVSAGAEVPDAGRREPTMTLAGWRRFVDSAPASFDLLAGEQWQALSGEQRGRYDEARINYHSELVVVATSTVREVARQGRLLTMLNRREISARRGLIVSGLPATGKSTALKQLGRTHELMVRERYPGTGRIPVVYVTTPPKGSPRKLAMEFARFLGLPPVRRGQNTTDIADAVCQVLIDARVDLVLVDEIHNLNLATSAGEDMSDHLKYFTEHLPATFAYAGVNVERSGLFTGVRGKQIAGRCVLVSTGPFPCQAEWASLLATLDAALRLHRHRPGTLPRLGKYLHQRTGGMIGSLSHLVRAAALTAILEGTEEITRKMLDGSIIAVSMPESTSLSVPVAENLGITVNPQPLADSGDQAACGPQLEDHLHRPFHRRLCHRPGCARPARSGVPDDRVSECASGLALLIRLVLPGTGQGPILPCSLKWPSGSSCACSVRVTAGRVGSSSPRWTVSSGTATCPASARANTTGIACTARTRRAAVTGAMRRSCCSTLMARPSRVRCTGTRLCSPTGPARQRRSALATAPLSCRAM